jgi:hypothetical protein
VTFGTGTDPDPDLGSPLTSGYLSGCGSVPKPSVSFRIFFNVLMRIHEVQIPTDPNPEQVDVTIYLLSNDSVESSSSSFVFDTSKSGMSGDGVSSAASMLSSQLGRVGHRYS